MLTLALFAEGTCDPLVFETVSKRQSPMEVGGGMTIHGSLEKQKGLQWLYRGYVGLVFHLEAVNIYLGGYDGWRRCQ